MLLERFLNYVSIDTQSDENSNETPSTKKQYDLLHLLQKELNELDVKNELDEFGRLYAWLEGNPDFERIGLCAHVDTAGECSGKNVKPQVIKNYDGKEIKLGNSGLVLSPKEFKKLETLTGKTLITTDGTTLLGGDDKCGVAIIMEVIEKYQQIPVNSRHPIAILFTPDEEIGRGPEHFDPQKFGAKYGYTIDGDDYHFIQIENFNAKKAHIVVEGKSIHPGDAKGTMINAADVIAEFTQLLPKKMVPSKTSGHQGFNHLTDIKGEVEKAEASYILRNHDANKLLKQVKDFEKAQKKLLKKYPGVKIELTIADQYRNMIEIINENPEVKEHIENIYDRLNIKYEFDPIRGGTDGATFSFAGCPCPNLGTGSYNHHGKYEFAVLEEMEKLVEIVTEIYKI